MEAQCDLSVRPQSTDCWKTPPLSSETFGNPIYTRIIHERTRAVARGCYSHHIVWLHDDYIIISLCVYLRFCDLFRWCMSGGWMMLRYISLSRKLRSEISLVPDTRIHQTVDIISAAFRNNCREGYWEFSDQEKLICWPFLWFYWPSARRWYNQQDVL